MNVKRARRTAAILALAGALAPITPAAAHSCSSPTQADVGKPFTVNLGVPAEQSAVLGVEVTVPGGFRADQVEPGEGWTAERDGRRVRFSGGKVPAFGCAYFILRGAVTERGKLVFPIVTRNEDASETIYESDEIGDPYGAQIVFAGVTPQDSDYFGAEEEGDGAPKYLVAVAVAGLAILGGAAAVARTRNRRTEAPPPAERRPVRTMRRTGRPR